jgi:hypothetical protein
MERIYQWTRRVVVWLTHMAYIPNNVGSAVAVKSIRTLLMLDEKVFETESSEKGHSQSDQCSARLSPGSLSMRLSLLPDRFCAGRY